MFTPKSILFMAVGIATLYTGATIARADTVTGSNEGSGCVWYDCQFDGGGSGKDKSGGGWEQHCKATGQFMRGDNDLGISDDNGNNLVLTCDDGDGDHDGDDHSHKVYDGDIKTRFDHSADVLWLLGVDHDQCTAPKIVIQFGDRATVLDDDRKFPADLAYSFDGFSYDIGGFCKLHKLPTPAPTTTSPPTRN